MLAAQTKPKAPSETKPQLPARLFLSDGIPPLKQACEFTLLVEEKAPPFLRMECVILNLCYVLIDPFLILPEYAPEFSDASCEEVGLSATDKPLVLAIVNFSRGVEHATANLVGPLLVHPHTGKAKQVILQNAGHYSARFKLLR